MSKDCIFCRIASGEIPADKVFESDEVVAFKDIHPLAPTHIIVIPKKHVATLDDLTDADLPLFAKMALAAKESAKKSGVFTSGYRLVVNCKKDAGQEVFHLHMHLMGGRPLGQMG